MDNLPLILQFEGTFAILFLCLQAANIFHSNSASPPCEIADCCVYPSIFWLFLFPFHFIQEDQFLSWWMNLLREVIHFYKYSGKVISAQNRKLTFVCLSVYIYGLTWAWKHVNKRWGLETRFEKGLKRAEERRKAK